MFVSGNTSRQMFRLWASTGFAEQHFEHSDHRGIQGQCVEVADPLDIVIDSYPARVVAFEHADVRIRHTVGGIRSGGKPPVFPAHAKHLAPDLQHACRIEQTWEEQAAVLPGTLPQFVGAAQQVRRVFRRVDLLHVDHRHRLFLSRYDPGDHSEILPISVSMSQGDIMRNSDALCQR